MSDFAWREYIFGSLTSDAGFTALVPIASVYGAGSLEEAPATKPFVVIKMDPELRGPYPGATRSRTSIWVHDMPGDYTEIDNIIKLAKEVLIGPVVGVGANQIRWSGDSADLADDNYRTIFRITTFDLIGKESNA